MNSANLFSLAPLALLALTGIMAMVLSPFWSAARLHRLTGAGFVATFALIAARYAAPEAPATYLLADDGAARFGAALVVLSGLATLAYLARDTAAREAPALVALATAGAMATVAATHAVTLFLGLEITTLAVVVLFAFPLGVGALEAGYKYFLMAGATAAALLMGLAFGFAGTGALGLGVWAGQEMIMSLGLALVLTALAFKFSLVPLHMWAPDVFSGAPASAAAFVGVVSKVAVTIVLIRLASLGMDGPVWTTGLAIAGAASAILGNLVALSQTSLRRMLGYSSIAHSGYMALVLSSGADLSGEAVLFYMSSYAPALLAALCVAGRLGPDAALGDLRGLIWRDPVSGVALSLALLSMAGLPPAVGFIGKIYIFSALAEAAAWPHLAAAILGAALAVFYYIRFAVQIFVMDAGSVPKSPAMPTPQTVMLVATSLVIVAVGVYPEYLVALVRSAVVLDALPAR
jgi:NADH-quinone oxidoreductase subunit N